MRDVGVPRSATVAAQASEASGGGKSTRGNTYDRTSIIYNFSSRREGSSTNKGDIFSLEPKARAAVEAGKLNQE